VPLLSFRDPLPGGPRKILVAGTTGAGKTTLAAAVSRRLRIPHVELDGLFHGPGWAPRPEFDSDVRAFTATSAWVTEWQYRQERALPAERADLTVWLDLGRAQVMWQVTRRTLQRRLRCDVLWKGNLEPPLRTILADPEHVVRWAWSTRPKTNTLILDLRTARPDLPVVHLTSRAQTEYWLTGPWRASISTQDS
jgi:adenylate kinase family enzyme